jgi:hypothetical protein
MTRFLLVILLAALTGCVTAPHDMRHGVLVDDWYEGVAGSPAPRHAWEPMNHACKYADGVTMYVGRSACP